MKTRLTPFRTRWMRSIASILAAAIGLMLLAACASSAPASAPAAATNPDSAQTAPAQQDYASAASDRLIELGVISPGSIEKAVDGDELIVEVPVGSPDGLAAGSLLIIDMSAHPNPDQLQPEDVLTLSVAGALSDSLNGLPDDLADQVRAQMAPDESALVVSRSKGRAEVRGPDGQLISDADESTGQNWRPGDALREAVVELAGGEKWLWDAGTNSWQPGESAVGAETAEPAMATEVVVAETSTAQPPTATPTEKSPTAVSATPTPLPAQPTEVPTQEPTEASTTDEAQSPELEQVMKNIEDWMSGRMQIDPSQRFTLLGEPETFRRFGSKLRDYSKERNSLVHGVFLGAGLCYGTESFFVVGLETQSQERFYVVLRGPTTNYDAKMSLVTSQARTIEGENDNPRMTVSRNELLANVGNLVGKPVILAFNIGFGDKDLKELDSSVVINYSHSIEIARLLDETLAYLFQDKKLSDLSPEQMALINRIQFLSGSKDNFLKSNPLAVMIIK